MFRAMWAGWIKVLQEIVGVSRDAQERDQTRNEEYSPLIRRVTPTFQVWVCDNVGPRDHMEDRHSVSGNITDIPSARWRI